MLTYGCSKHETVMDRNNILYLAELSMLVTPETLLVLFWQPFLLSWRWEWNSKQARDKEGWTKKTTEDHFSAHCEVGMERGVRKEEKRNQGRLCLPKLRPDWHFNKGRWIPLLHLQRIQTHIFTHLWPHAQIVYRNTGPRQARMLAYV